MRTLKLTLTIFALIISFCFVSAQEAVTPKGSLNIVKEIKPPILSVVDGSVTFVDKTGNNAIDANETCFVRFDVQNTGMGEATGCVASIAMKGTTSGLKSEKKRLATIPVGGKIQVELPVTANMQTADGEVTLTVSVEEPLGFNTLPFDLAVHTRAFNAPFVHVADYAVDGQAVLQKNMPFDLQVAVQNIKPGMAEQVKVDVVLPQGVYLLSQNENLSYGTLEGGKAEMITYKMIVPSAYQQPTVPVEVKIRERYGKYAESKTINLPLNQQIAGHTIAINENVVENNSSDITQVTIGSDVDKNIPQSKRVNSNTYVLIFANEKYKNVASVPYALRDGDVFRQYCEQTLGITTKNHIRTYKDATYSDILSGIEWLKTALAVNTDACGIVYYTGHGVPDEASKSAYLLPVDGNSAIMRTAYSVDELYRELGSTNRQVTVFLDACFSGAKRDGAMLASAKGVAIKAKAGAPQGKTVVFSAATGDETAGFYRQQQHGMFTYWLLKMLQQTQGSVTYKQLNDYLLNNVRRSSFDENGKVQTPTVMTGAEATDWQSWTLK